MNLNELIYNSFNLKDYEHFLLEVFNINLNNKEDLLYLISDSHQANIGNLFYYGNYMDDNFNEIELYVIKLRNIDGYKIIEDAVFNILSLNQTNNAFVTVYSDYSNEWFFTYLFSEYRVVENRLVGYNSKVDDYIHWYGFASADSIFSKMLTIDKSTDNIKNLLKVNHESMLVIRLGQLLDKLSDKNKYSINSDMDYYQLLLRAMTLIINDKKADNTNIGGICDEIIDIQADCDEKITADTIVEVYDYVNRQKSISQKHVKSVCEDTLIEYLIQNTGILRDDIINYIKHSYYNRNLITKHIHEATRNGGRSYINMKIPLSIIYNIDLIDNLLENIKILDFSINSGITITTMTYLITKLKYVNRLLEGYSNTDIKQLYKKTVEDNIYMITLNDKSVTTTEILLNLFAQTKANINFTDALTLYDEYEYIKDTLKNINKEDKTKDEIIEDIVNKYNMTHMHTKMNVGFIKRFEEKNGYQPLIYQLDYEEVFANGHKFDIIISNIEQVNLTGQRETKRQLKKYTLYDNNQRYEYYYIEKAIQLIDNNGIIALMVDDEYKTSEDKKVSEYLKQYNILVDKKWELIYTDHKRKIR